MRLKAAPAADGITAGSRRVVASLPIRFPLFPKKNLPPSSQSSLRKTSFLRVLAAHGGERSSIFDLLHFRKDDDQGV